MQFSYQLTWHNSKEELSLEDLIFPTHTIPVIHPALPAGNLSIIKALISYAMIKFLRLSVYKFRDV
jgi:hypothetical protein